MQEAIQKGGNLRCLDEGSFWCKASFTTRNDPMSEQDPATK
jgi:hypothetical protein